MGGGCAGPHGGSAGRPALLTTELFGTVVRVQTFATEEEAVRLENDTEYGLAASV